MTWVCEECGNEDYCPYIDEVCYQCEKDTRLVWVEPKSGGN